MRSPLSFATSASWPGSRQGASSDPLARSEPPPVVEVEDGSPRHAAGKGHRASYAAASTVNDGAWRPKPACYVAIISCMTRTVPYGYRNRAGHVCPACRALTPAPANRGGGSQGRGETREH